MPGGTGRTSEAAPGGTIQGKEQQDYILDRAGSWFPALNCIPGSRGDPGARSYHFSQSLHYSPLFHQQDFISYTSQHTFTYLVAFTCFTVLQTDTNTPILLSFNPWLNCVWTATV